MLRTVSFVERPCPVGGSFHQNIRTVPKICARFRHTLSILSAHRGLVYKNTALFTMKYSVCLI